MKNKIEKRTKQKLKKFPELWYLSVEFLGKEWEEVSIRYPDNSVECCLYIDNEMIIDFENPSNPENIGKSGWTFVGYIQ